MDDALQIVQTLTPENRKSVPAPAQAIFRAALLPHPAVDGTHYPKSALEFALSAALPLAIFVAYHLVSLGC